MLDKSLEFGNLTPVGSSDKSMKMDIKKLTGVVHGNTNSNLVLSILSPFTKSPMPRRNLSLHLCPLRPWFGISIVNQGSAEVFGPGVDVDLESASEKLTNQDLDGVSKKGWRRYYYHA